MEHTPPAVDKAERLLTWFKSKGGYLHPSVIIEHTAAHGFRLIAKEPLPENTDFVTCPLALTLSQLNLDPEEQYVPHYDSKLPLLRGKVPDHVLGYLLLIEQFVLKEKSLWHPYIDALPGKRDVPTPLWRNSVYYKNTPLENAREERLRSLREDHKHALSAMTEANMRSSDLYKECDFENFLWAATIMSSRSFSSQGILEGRSSHPESFSILYPVLDLANHYTRARVRWKYGKSLNDQSFTIVNKIAIDAGSEIFNNYGPKGNAELLLGYGFAEENNPVEQVYFRLVVPEGTLADVSAETVPFGMDLEQVTNAQGGLRKPDNLLGRYNISVPFFRGFPPNAVFAAYVQALRLKRIELSAAPKLPPGRLVLFTLLFLFRAMQEKCVRLAQTDTSEKTGENLIYPILYHKGQSDICNYIRGELTSVISKLAPGVVPTRIVAMPAIYSIMNAIAIMERTRRDYHKAFREAAECVSWMDLRAMAASKYAQNLWVWLLAFWHMQMMVRPDFEPHGVFSEWISSLLHYYPTQLRVKVDTSDSLILGHKTKVIIADFKNRFGEYFVKVSDHSIKDLHENMEVCVEWAVRVVEGDVFSYGPLDNPAYCMYFCAKEYVESWISEEADMHGSDPLVMVQPF